MIGTHKDFDLAVGLLEVIGCNVYLVGNANKKYIETLQENIHNQKVAYVDYRKTYVLNPSNAKKLCHIPTDNFACLAHKKIDLLKCDASVINTDILKKIIREKHPYIICLGSCITSESNTRNAYSFLTQEGYTATYVNYSRNAITFTYQATSSPLSLQHIIPLKTSTGSTGIQEHFVDLFQNEPVKTEYYAYQYIQQYPIKTNAQYLVVPWSQLIHNYLFDKSAITLDRVLSIRSHGSFTICQHILYAKILHVMKHIGVQTLFTPHVDKHYFGLTVKPFPHFAICGPPPAEKKDIWYSLVGNDTHKTRRLLFDAPHPPEAYVKERKNWHFSRDVFNPNCTTKEQQEKDKQEYQDVLARSRFSLCPRGTGASTIRFWESLKAGAIPVVVCDDLYLPEGFDWSSCIIAVAEKDVRHIPDTLRTIAPEKEIKMRKQCIKAYEHFSEEQFVSCVRYHFANQK